MTYYTYLDSPIGRLLLTSDGTSLTGLYMEPHRHGPENAESREGWVRDDEAAPLPLARQQLTDYFAGSRQRFDLPLAAQGTAFQQRVWKELLEIPFGQTWSYGELARRIGQPNASRAVGLANGRNPISIIVPCHRVIGANGKLVGYGGGLERKTWLLQLERGDAAAGEPNQLQLLP
jgi:methylated-DNA-[protein]-cysteine S-methyltransferase